MRKKVLLQERFPSCGKTSFCRWKMVCLLCAEDVLPFVHAEEGSSAWTNRRTIFRTKETNHLSPTEEGSSARSRGRTSVFSLAQQAKTQRSSILRPAYTIKRERKLEQYPRWWKVTKTQQKTFLASAMEEARRRNGRLRRGRKRKEEMVLGRNVFLFF